MARVHVMGGYLNVEGMSGGLPDNSLPGTPVYPDHGLPGDQPGIDNSLPPGTPPIGVTLPEPPPGIWPPPSFSRPIVPIGPDNTLPVQPGTIWPSPGRPARPDNSLPSQTFWVVAGIPGVGWRYIAIDPSLEVGHPLPPHAQPK